MAKRVSRYGVSSATMLELIGEPREIIVNTTRNSLHVHDGVTPNGFEHALADASNIVNATASIPGRMTTAQVTELTTATADIVLLEAADVTINSLIDTIEADIVDIENDITAINTSLTDIIAGRFAANTQPVNISVFQSTIPTGWTLNTSFDDRVPLVEATQGQGGATGGSWTISGLSGTHSHTHSVGTLAADGLPTGVINLAAGAFDAATDSHSHSISGNTGAASSSSVSVTQDGSWRINYVKVLVITRSTWGT